MTTVRIALPNKGRLNQSAIRLMNKIGFPIPESGNRTLLAEFAMGRYQILLARAQDIPEFVGKGGLILGICNGFQVLAKMGILPELAINHPPRLTLTNNDSNRFECRWVRLGTNRESACVFTRGIAAMYLPVAHGEGKVMAKPGVLSKIAGVLGAHSISISSVIQKGRKEESAVPIFIVTHNER